MIKKGRKKSSLKGRPNNLYWWRFTLLKPEEANAFVEKGDKRQKMDMKYALKFLKTSEPKFFEKINGKELLKKLK